MEPGGNHNTGTAGRDAPQPHYIPIVTGPDHWFGGTTDAVVAAVHDFTNPDAYGHFKRLLALALRRNGVQPSPQQLALIITGQLTTYMLRLQRDPAAAFQGVEVGRLDGRPIVLIDAVQARQIVAVPQGAPPVLHALPRHSRPRTGFAPSV